MKLKLDFNDKIVFLLFLSVTSLFSAEVLIVTKEIRYKEKIQQDKLSLKQVDNIDKGCIPLRLEDLEKDSYSASHYMFANSIVCMKDVIKYEKESILFDFGILQIEQEGKVIYENDKFIRIKKQDGTVEKIYKDGKIE